MFRLTASVEIDGFAPIKPSSLSWSRHIDNYSDSAKLEMPAICRYIDKTGTVYDDVVTGNYFKEGTKILIKAGYDGANDVQFVGFIKRINSSIPLEIECEGYAYQLRNKTINKSYGRTTVKQVLLDVIEGTDIKLNDANNGEIVFEPKEFKGVSRTTVLDWLKENYHLKIFFNQNVLFAGLGVMYQTKSTLNHRLNWNVIKDDDLLFNTYPEATVNIEGYSKLPNGSTLVVKAKNIKPGGAIKKVKMLHQNQGDLQKGVDALQEKENKKGYVGSLTTFLKPFANIGDVSNIIDKKLGRQGKYLIDGIEGHLTTAGGRQKIHIDFSVGK